MTRFQRLHNCKTQKCFKKSTDSDEIRGNNCLRAANYADKILSIYIHSSLMSQLQQFKCENPAFCDYEKFWNFNMCLAWFTYRVGLHGVKQSNEWRCKRNFENLKKPYFEREQSSRIPKKHGLKVKKLSIYLFCYNLHKLLPRYLYILFRPRFML